MTFLWKTARSCASLSLFKYKSPASTKPVGLKETGSQMLPDRNRWANKAPPYNLNCTRAVKERNTVSRFNMRLVPRRRSTQKVDELVNSIQSRFSNSKSPQRNGKEQTA